jgi:hypothetical protein
MIAKTSCANRTQLRIQCAIWHEPVTAVASTLCPMSDAVGRQEASHAQELHLLA